MKPKGLITIVFFILFLIPITVFSAEWTQMASGTTNRLNGVWGTSGTDVFAVGEKGTILHYDGDVWSPVAFPGITTDLYGIWGTSHNDIFVVGGYNGELFHYDGTGWSPMWGGGTYYLYGIWGSSGTDVFAVGYDWDYFHGIIIHYNGINWSYMVGGIYDYLYGIWGTSGTDVYVVGQYGRIRHYNGTRWSMEVTVGSEANLYSIWGTSGLDIFAVGSTEIGECVGSDPLCQIMCKPPLCQYIFHNSYLIEYYNGSTWLASIKQDTPTLYGIWGSSSSDYFAVGSSGAILHYDGTSWANMNSPTTNTLNGIWGSSGTDVFAVGADGTILHYGEPTVIELSSFTATESNRKVILKWTTESEIDNAGFNLYRDESADGMYVKINGSLIPAQGSPTSGATYQFIDENVKNRITYFYKLEDIDLNGTSTMHVPVIAVPRMIHIRN